MSFLAPFFKTLRLPECRIAFVDPLFGRAFSNVDELNVSRNLLQVPENLPPALRGLLPNIALHADPVGGTGVSADWPVT